MCHDYDHYPKYEKRLLAVCILCVFFFFCVCILAARTDVEGIRNKQTAQYKLDNDAITRNMKLQEEILHGK